jgi:methylmalonyl-CoA/ethylmalonyl-CoA epimerase
MTAAGSTLFGPAMQLGFVVPDLEAAALHWARLGVGPFFLLEHIQYAECRYRGQAVSFDMSVAVAQWGEVQVELIRQHDPTPTIYTDFADTSGAGLQHVGVMTDSVAAQLERLSARGISPVQSGSTANGIRFAYVDTDALAGGHPGGMIELIERGPAIDGFFAMVRAAAVGWDGERPLRRLG